LLVKGDLRYRLLKDVLLELAEDATAATTSLLVEFAADKAGSRPGRYEFFLCSLVKSMLADPVKNSKRLSRILCDAPSLPHACLALILGLLDSKVSLFISRLTHNLF